MNKTTLLSIAAILASSSVLTDASHSAVLSEPDLGNALEQRIEKLSHNAWARLETSDHNTGQSIARAWGNGNGRAFANGGGARRGFANGGGGGFGNAYRAGFANW
ncbi:GrrA/OscA1 family cyclophane-containing rSAM-modified RiPP [Synechococcus sp. ROS8604]|uniref:GrrA/OscA1 family cyclophane-containing rSAM-modified RiPP n=1 Tax=Synechococcus sp. ROS8604 TaxID=1442557 RepID=UPI001648C394|nr:GrrA/OscA1 family cyclophane-containing rSAM-modified RiPP [Synechococcus sp. ROS8604]QNI89769.1 rSAM-associated Gly-rich repeat secreted protein [Synechococcus sp. ROS8604]